MIHLYILHNDLPESISMAKFVIFISCEGLILPLKLNYICVCVDMFVHNITESVLISLSLLCNIITVCESY